MPNFHWSWDYGIIHYYSSWKLLSSKSAAAHLTREDKRGKSHLKSVIINLIKCDDPMNCVHQNWPDHYIIHTPLTEECLRNWCLTGRSVSEASCHNFGLPSKPNITHQHQNQPFSIWIVLGGLLSACCSACLYMEWFLDDNLLNIAPSALADWLSVLFLIPPSW